MTNEQLGREKRKQSRLHKLGTNNPHCGMCSETDDRCMELHHVADMKRDDCTVILCRNCHRKVSDDQKDHPALNRAADPKLDAIGHFLLGLADMLRYIIDMLYEFGHALIGRAAPAIDGVAK